MSGGGIGINLSGTDWLGIGATASEAYKGTAECGSRPNCLWTAECKRKTQAFEDCVKESNRIKYEIGMAGANNRPQLLQTTSDPQKKVWLIIAISVAVLIILILLFK